MWWVYRMPMKMKLIIALQPLLLALCWFAGSGILTRIQTERQMENIAQLTALARSAGNVVHELQKERGMSVGFLGAEGKTFKDELTAQRALTDREIEVFVRSLSDTALPEGDAANSLRKTFCRLPPSGKTSRDWGFRPPMSLSFILMSLLMC